MLKSNVNFNHFIQYCLNKIINIIELIIKIQFDYLYHFTNKDNTDDNNEEIEKYIKNISFLFNSIIKISMKLQAT